MKSLYKEDEYSMNFTNEEIIKFFVEPLETDDRVSISLFSAEDKKIRKDSKEAIIFVCFDGVLVNFLPEC